MVALRSRRERTTARQRCVCRGLLGVSWAPGQRCPFRTRTPDRQTRARLERTRSALRARTRNNKRGYGCCAAGCRHRGLGGPACVQQSLIDAGYLTSLIRLASVDNVHLLGPFPGVGMHLMPAGYPGISLFRVRCSVPCPSPREVISPSIYGRKSRALLTDGPSFSLMFRPLG